MMIDNNCNISCQLSLQYVQYYIQDNINVLNDTNEMLITGRTVVQAPC